MLQIDDTIVEVIRLVRPLAEQIGRCDPSLAKQLRDALSSVALNCCEGTGQRGARKANHYAMALGSARESRAALRVAVAWGFIEGISPTIDDRLDKTIATLFKLANR